MCTVTVIVGVYHYKARTYSPIFGGRFLQTDPIGYWGGPNLYAYVGNDPVNLTDSTGRDTEIIVTGTRITASAAVISFRFSHIGFLTRHKYTVPRALVCDAEKAECKRAKEKIKSPVCNIPGQGGKGPINEAVPYLASIPFGPPGPGGRTIPGGFVFADVSPSGFSVINRTTPVHAFQGTVTRTYSTDSRGNWYASTVGVGNSPILGFDGFNELIGPMAFEMVNAACKAFMESD